MTRTFPLEGLRRNVFLVIAGVNAVLGVVLAGVAYMLLSGPTFGLLDVVFVSLPVATFGGLALLIVRATDGVRLELSDQGIRLVVPGATYEAEWADAKAIGRAMWGPLSGEALLLHRHARVKRAWWFAVIEDPSWSRAIPLAPFALPVHGSRLEAALRMAVPRLFETASPSGAGSDSLPLDELVGER